MPNIDLMLTHSCNLRCKYCYEKDTNYAKARMSRDIIKKIINKIKDSPDLSITFWGGEPTLEYKNIDYVVSTLKETSSYFTSSNGYNLQPIIPYLLKWQNYDFKLQVSYDFEPNQSNNRINKKGKSSSNKVIENILLLAKNKVKFNIKTTITPEYLVNIKQIYYDFQSLRKKILDINPQNDISLAITLITDSIIPIIPPSVIETFSNQMTDILADAIDKNHNFLWFMPNTDLCSAGSDNICIDCDGTVYVCHSAIFTPHAKDHILGNINDPLEKLLAKKPWTGKQPRECKDCPAIFCYKCNVHSYEKSKKKSYIQKMYDFCCDKNYCSIMKIISNYTYAYNKIINSGV